MKLFKTTSHMLNQLNIVLTQTSVRLILFIFSLSFSGVVLSQNSKPDLWNLEKSQDGIEVYSKIVSCETEGSTVHFDYLFFKVVNNSESTKNVSLKFEIYFDEGCNGCHNGNETSRIIELNAGEFLESSCSNYEDKLSYFILNPNFQDSWHYSHSEVYVQLINN